MRNKFFGEIDKKKYGKSSDTGGNRNGFPPGWTKTAAEFFPRQFLSVYLFVLVSCSLTTSRNSLAAGFSRDFFQAMA